MEINGVGEEESIHKSMEATGIEIQHYYRGDKNPDTGEYFCKICEELKHNSEESE